MEEELNELQAIAEKAEKKSKSISNLQEKVMEVLVQPKITKRDRSNLKVKIEGSGGNSYTLQDTHGNKLEVVGDGIKTIPSNFDFELLHIKK
jgi:glutamate synthase domain-containing protein 3